VLARINHEQNASASPRADDLRGSPSPIPPSLLSLSLPPLSCVLLGLRACVRAYSILGAYVGRHPVKFIELRSRVHGLVMKLTRLFEKTQRGAPEHPPQPLAFGRGARANLAHLIFNERTASSVSRSDVTGVRLSGSIWLSRRFQNEKEDYVDGSQHIGHSRMHSVAGHEKKTGRRWEGPPVTSASSYSSSSLCLFGGQT
jgi:hypothetical protein